MGSNEMNSVILYILHQVQKLMLYTCNGFILFCYVVLSCQVYILQHSGTLNLDAG